MDKSEIIGIIYEYLVESNDGYEVVGSSYWFGRLCLIQELFNKIEGKVYD